MQEIIAIVVIILILDFFIQTLIFKEKYSQTRSHTDGFQRNNAKCLDEKGISRFVPHSSI